MVGMFKPKSPDVKPEATMPVADDGGAAQTEARRRAQQELMTRSGRASTILTDGASKNYSTRTLG